jgi:hypothetical protein
LVERYLPALYAARHDIWSSTVAVSEVGEEEIREGGVM